MQSSLGRWMKEKKRKGKICKHTSFILLFALIKYELDKLGVFMDTFSYILICIVVFIVFVCIKSKHDKNEIYARYQYKNEKEWGQVPLTTYTQEKFQAIKEYYLANRGNYDVDDITWNDVDMDTIYMLMNNTQSSMGEDYLYATLRKLEMSEEKLQERERLISFFQNNPGERDKLQVEFRFMGKLKNLSLYKYINTTESIPTHNPIASIFMASVLVLSLVLMGLSCVTSIPAIYGVVMFVCSVVNNIIHYFHRKAKIEKYFSVFMYIIRVLDGAKSIQKLSIPKLQKYFMRLQEITKMFADFERGSFIVFFDNKAQGSFFDMFLDYFRMLFHIDLIKFDFMVKKVHEKRKELNEIYEILGLLDAMIAVASFRTLFEDRYCVPELSKDNKPIFDMIAGTHPLIDNPVANSIRTSGSILITGSNASGKSTFIKTAAINGILAQTVHTALATRYQASYFKIYSSMALRDDLQSNESYYIVEIKSLKRILEQVNTDIPTLCFVDEVLRGTNTLERIAASSYILKSLGESNAICFAATHDLELAHILQKYYENYHFEEQVENNDIIFDYSLRKGKAMTRNAIKLLGIMGYDKKIIESSEKLANDFQKNGVWEQI